MDPSSKPRDISRIWIYVVFGVLLVILLVWSSLRVLRETPTRQASVEIPNAGWTTMTMTTEPFPPVSGGVVVVRVRGEDNRGTARNLGPTLPYRFGSQGSENTIGSGNAVPEAQGTGYQAEVRFPSPGGYWLEFDVGAERPVRFQLDVRPPQ